MALQQSDMIAPMIEVRGLSKHFGAQTIFENLDLDIYPGEILGVVGKSGSGKSVLLRCLTGLEKYQAGTISLYTMKASQNRKQVANKLEGCSGILFQDGALFSALTVLQNVQVPMREQTKLPKPIMDELAYLKLSMVGLDASAATKYPSELSGGMRKRAGLARALALDPEIVFLDEPTAGLDPIGAADFDQLIRDLQRTLGLTVFMVTHDLDSIFKVCDRVVVLADQKIVRQGSPQELASDPRHPWIKSYFCGERSRAVMAKA